jgi:hypothetical protein
MRKLLFIFQLLPMCLQAQGGLPDYSRITLPSTSPTSPTISATGTFSNFVTTPTAASTAQTISIGGSNLTAAYQITCTITQLQVSPDGTTYSAFPYSVSPSAGTVSTRNISFQVPTGTAPGTYTGTVAFKSTGATEIDKTVTIIVASMVASPTSITGLNGIVGTPGTSQTVTITFSTTTPAAVAPTNTEISKDGGSTYGSSQTLSGSSPTSLLIRTTAAAGAGAISGTLALTGANVTAVNIPVSGTVSSSAPSADSMKISLDTTQPQSTGNWTNTNADIATAPGNLTYVGGVSSSITFTVFKANWTPLTGHCATPNNGNTVGVTDSLTRYVPNQVLREVWYSSETSGSYDVTKPKAQFSGLTPGAFYTVVMGGSASSSALNIITRFSCTGATSSPGYTFDMEQNTTHVFYYRLQADGSGIIKLYWNADTLGGTVGNTAANGFVILYTS